MTKQSGNIERHYVLMVRGQDYRGRKHYVAELGNMNELHEGAGSWFVSFSPRDDGKGVALHGKSWEEVGALDSEGRLHPSEAKFFGMCRGESWYHGLVEDVQHTSEVMNKCSLKDSPFVFSVS